MKKELIDILTNSTRPKGIKKPQGFAYSAETLELIDQRAKETGISKSDLVDRVLYALMKD